MSPSFKSQNLGVGGGGRERMAVDLYEAFRKFRFLDEVNNDNTIAKALFCNNFSSIFNKKSFFSQIAKSV